MTRLVTVAHGTRQALGNLVARDVTAAAAERLGMEAVASYVELCDPLFADVLAGSSEETAAVPLLLSTGYHVRQDLPAAVSASPAAVRLGPPLGPDPLLAAAQVERLLSAGARQGQPVVLVAAGSRDPLATADLEAARELLAEVWDGPVRLATIAGLGSRPGNVVEPGDAVSPYLLSTGYFFDRARDESTAAGATVVADVVGVHPLVVDLVVSRTRALLD